MLRTAVLAALASVLASCATPYKPTGILGGFDAQELREDVYRVRFGGNGYTTQETAQTYWLYQCAELTLEKGYYGFEILSDMRFVMRHTPEELDEQAYRRNRIATSNLMRVSDGVEEFADVPGLHTATPQGPHDDTASESVRVAAGGATFIYVPMSSSPKPLFEGDVHLLKRPFEPAPPKLFVASALKAALEQYVKSDKCGFGNICPHVHDYLFLKGKLQRQ